MRLFSWNKHLDELRKDKDGWISLDFLCPADKCFVCGDILDDDLVMWDGVGDDTPSNKGRCQIWMHPKCAVYLGENLVKDGLITKQECIIHAKEVNQNVNGKNHE